MQQTRKTIEYMYGAKYLKLGSLPRTSANRSVRHGFLHKQS